MVLQFVGVVAMLYLPSLNADIIDKGVATGDTGYIMRTGGLMLAVALLQVACAVSAVWFGARTSMSLGRDLRRDLFQRVGTFSNREVQEFGAPSLITRSTNDVTQVQMLVLMACTIAVSAPIMMVGGVIMALREDFGLGWILAVVVPALFLSVGSRGQPDGAQLPQDADAHRRGQPRHAGADHRHPSRTCLRAGAPRGARDSAGPTTT